MSIEAEFPEVWTTPVKTLTPFTQTAQQWFSGHAPPLLPLLLSLPQKCHPMPHSERGDPMSTLSAVSIPLHLLSSTQYKKCFSACSIADISDLGAQRARAGTGSTRGADYTTWENHLITPSTPMTYCFNWIAKVQWVFERRPTWSLFYLHVACL